MGALRALLFVLIGIGVASAANWYVMNLPRTKLEMTSTRVFGGHIAKNGQFPYMIHAIFSSDIGMSTCSASLVAANKVLLAAHCFNNLPSPKPENLLAVAGETSMKNYMEKRLRIPFSQDIDGSTMGLLQERRAKEIIISSNFEQSADSITNDVALAITKENFQLNSNVQLIPISTEPMTATMNCVIHGWGLQENNVNNRILMFSEEVQAAPVQFCTTRNTGPFICKINSNQGICQGDSGSPLVCNGKVYGVASHVLSKSSNPMCAEDVEELFASLSPELSWILPIMGSTSTNLNSNNGLILIATVLVTLQLRDLF